MTGVSVTVQRATCTAVSRGSVWCPADFYVGKLNTHTRKCEEVAGGAFSKISMYLSQEIAYYQKIACRASTAPAKLYHSVYKEEIVSHCIMIFSEPKKRGRIISTADLWGQAVN